ncbi:MAG: hypothetical protein RLZZ408_1379 [Verrucomicrobiota bacterium]
MELLLEGPMIARKLVEGLILEIQPLAAALDEKLEVGVIQMLQLGLGRMSDANGRRSGVFHDSILFFFSKHSIPFLRHNRIADFLK